MADLTSAILSSPAAGAESFAASVSMAPLKLHPKSRAMNGAFATKTPCGLAGGPLQSRQVGRTVR